MFQSDPFAVGGREGGAETFPRETPQLLLFSVQVRKVVLEGVAVLSSPLGHFLKISLTAW